MENKSILTLNIYALLAIFCIVSVLAYFVAGIGVSITFAVISLMYIGYMLYITYNMKKKQKENEKNTELHT